MRFVSLSILTLILSFCLFSQPQRAYKVLAVMVEFQTDDDPLTTGNGKFDLSFPNKKSLTRHLTIKDILRRIFSF
jgi:hypothetical protein